jgi:hypothetical protein
MSDPVTNVEIEDVLSSIRRLVSEDVRPAVSASKRKAPDRLVLTPSLRVNVDESAARPPERPANGPIVLTNPAPEVLDETLDGDIAIPRLEEVPLAGDVPDQTDDLSDLPQVAEDLPEADDHDHGAVMYVSDDEAEIDGETDTLLSQLVEQEVTRVLETVDEEAPLTETLSEVAQAVEVAELDLSEQTIASADESTVGSRVEQSDAAPEMDPPQSWSSDAPLDSKIAALEKLVGYQPDEYDGDQVDVEPTADATFVHRPLGEVSWDKAPEPSLEATVEEAPFIEVDSHDELTNAVADVVMLSEDAPSEEAAPRPVFHTDEERYERQSDLLAEPEAADVSMIDEETLRTMVSDIVRQELQGVLGERITRNVRKLVRREIHRVLMSQDYE